MTSAERARRRAQAKAVLDAFTYVVENPGKAAWVTSTCTCETCGCRPYILYVPPLLEGQ